MLPLDTTNSVAACSEKELALPVVKTGAVAIYPERSCDKPERQSNDGPDHWGLRSRLENAGLGIWTRKTTKKFSFSSAIAVEAKLAPTSRPSE